LTEIEWRKSIVKEGKVIYRKQISKRAEIKTIERRTQKGQAEIKQANAGAIKNLQERNY